MKKFLSKVLAPIITSKQQYSIKMSKLPDSTDRRGQKRPLGCPCLECVFGQSPKPTLTAQSGSSVPLDLSTTKRRRIEVTLSRGDFLNQPSQMKENRPTAIMKLAVREHPGHGTGHWNDLFKASGSEDNYYQSGWNLGSECNSDDSERRRMRKFWSEEDFLKQLFPLYNSREVVKLSEENLGSDNEMKRNDLIEASGHESNSDRSESICLGKPPSVDNLTKELFEFNRSRKLKLLIDSCGDEGDSDEPDEKECVRQGRSNNKRHSNKKNQKSRTNQRRRSSYGTNFYNGNERHKREGLRPIIIDGSNVAMSYSKGKYFSSKALEICVDFFLDRNHKVYALVPHFRICKGNARDQHILNALYHEGHLYFTPSRKVDGRLQVSYDDRYMVQLACSTGGVLVSNDQYRDLLLEDPSWADTIKNRLLMFTWIENHLFFPQDPHGKGGPTLDQLLRF